MPRTSSGARLYKTSHPRTPFLVRHQLHGVRRSFWFSKKDEAEKKRNELNTLINLEGVKGIAMDAAARADFFTAREILGSRLPLVEAAKFCVKHHPTPPPMI